MTKKSRCRNQEDQKLYSSRCLRDKKRQDAATISNQNENNSQRISMACRHAAGSKEKDLFAVFKQIQDTPESTRKIRKLVEDP